VLVRRENAKKSLKRGENPVGPEKFLAARPMGAAHA
jgi:hypothetical protein